MKSKHVLMVLFLGVFSSLYAQPPVVENVPNLKLKFSPITVGKFDRETDEMVDSWKTFNTGIYTVKSSEQTIEYIEYKGDGREVVKTWRNEIIRYIELDSLYVFGIMREEGEVRILIWKDKRMLGIEDIEWDYLIVEKFEE